MQGPYAQQQIENWVGDFCSSDAILAFPSGVREHASAVLVRFMIATCEVRNVEPGDMEEADLKAATDELKRLEKLSQKVNVSASP